MAQPTNVIASLWGRLITTNNASKNSKIFTWPDETRRKQLNFLTKFCLIITYNFQHSTRGGRFTAPIIWIYRLDLPPPVETKITRIFITIMGAGSQRGRQLRIFHGGSLHWVQHAAVLWPQVDLILPITLGCDLSIMFMVILLKLDNLVAYWIARAMASHCPKVAISFIGR